MTVPDENARNTYVGDNTTATYAFNFEIQNVNHLAVYEQDTQGAQTTLAINVDYTIPADDANDPNGGEVTLLAGNLATGHTLVLERDPPLTQLRDITNQGDIYPETQERAWDLLCHQIQSLANGQTRGLAILETDVGANTVVPVGVAGSSLGWNENGDLTNIPQSDDTVSTTYEIPYSANLVINRSNGKHQRVILTGNVDSITWAGFQEGYEMFVHFVQDGTGGRSVDFTEDNNTPDLFFANSSPMDVSAGGPDTIWQLGVRLIFGQLMAFNGPNMGVPPT